MADIFIAYKKDDPSEMFFYRLLDMEVNTLEVQLLDPIKDKESDYIFIVPFNGIKLSLVGKLLQYDEKTKSALFLIKESDLELRKYPRIKLPPKLVKVEIDSYKGYLVNISFGGIKVQLEKNITGELLNYLQIHYPIKAKIYLPTGKVYTVYLQLVSFNVFKSWLSFKFVKSNSETIQLYKDIVAYLKNNSLPIQMDIENVV
jgi:hypothetical protein